MSDPTHTPLTGDDSKLSRFQKFRPRRVHRSELKNAPYNPRAINELNARKLREILEKKGLVEALTWNVRTGNLVGGHQRLTQLDILEKEKAGDYELDVNVVDVTEKRERELNIILNNEALRGEFVPELMVDMFDYGIRPEDVALDVMDLEMVLPADDFDRLFPAEEPAEVAASANAINEIARKPAPAPSTPFDPPAAEDPSLGAARDGSPSREDSGDASSEYSRGEDDEPAEEPRRNAAGRIMSPEELVKYDASKAARAKMNAELANDSLTLDVSQFALTVVCGTSEERDHLARILLAKHGFVDCRVLAEKLGTTFPATEQA